MNAFKLGDVATFVRGITFKPTDVVEPGTSGAVNCMRTKNVQAELDLSDVWAIDSRHVRRENQFLRSGDILISSANSWNLVGKCCWVPDLADKSTFGGFISVLRADTAKVHPRYLYHWFGSSDIQATVRSFGRQTTNISNLDFKRCLDLDLPLPPLDEQARLADILDKANALRARRREAIGRLDELAQSIFIGMFGDPASNAREWHVSTVGEVAEQVTDGEHLTPKRESEGIKLLSARNVRDGYIDFENVDYIGPEEHARIRRRCDPRRGDILISCSGTIGRVAPVETDEPFSLVRSAALVRPRTSTVTTDYLASYLRTPELKARMLREARSSSQANLFQGPIRNLPVLCPPVDLQSIFGQRLQAVGQIRATQSGQLDELDALFASLQYRAFRGEL
ncbi:restriction endonuclease subunit S [Frankia sp. CNm7]|uniref:Restriction endonuclease subunit S n=1 Tax=Frankia nepalensis TaxID=1836974 RepID=A0A937URI7_9ACTN|nr:restriction endonuclease subunit S [Frankia nepalensis]MBL7495660.1 restriction endonuclease subunit S [Frankia nepalensis]MBL7510274.1 restriction endonuclease subunit S [Frankia nepalensis]MBL7520470.1 restriction endonuclease subunit S [Frankia nepalensis]MBL7631183.1 restriction endonuclease subunit S [Frankia nepalensis]